jgi:hypothetical protein
MKYKIVLVPFPFDDLTATKVRPAACLTDEIKPTVISFWLLLQVKFRQMLQRPIL